MRKIICFMLGLVFLCAGLIISGYNGIEKRSDFSGLALFITGLVLMIGIEMTIKKDE